MESTSICFRVDILLLLFWHFLIFISVYFVHSFRFWCTFISKYLNSFNFAIVYCLLCSVRNCICMLCLVFFSAGLERTCSHSFVRERNCARRNIKPTTHIHTHTHACSYFAQHPRINPLCEQMIPVYQQTPQYSVYHLFGCCFF